MINNSTKDKLENETLHFGNTLLGAVLLTSSSRENKRIVCSLNGNIKVIVAGEVVWQGTQPFSAIEAYNEITEKYVNPLANFRL